MRVNVVIDGSTSSFFRDVEAYAKTDICITEFAQVCNLGNHSDNERMIRLSRHCNFKEWADYLSEVFSELFTEKDRGYCLKELFIGGLEHGDSGNPFVIKKKFYLSPLPANWKEVYV